ncbi:MAG: hypothetical protein ABH887_00835 [bacterium]
MDNNYNDHQIKTDPPLVGGITSKQTNELNERHESNGVSDIKFPNVPKSEMVDKEKDIISKSPISPKIFVPPVPPVSKNDISAIPKVVIPKKENNQDIKNNETLNSKAQSVESYITREDGVDVEPKIRTMYGDIEMLKKGENPSKVAVPPKNLPIVELKREQEIDKPQDELKAIASKEATRQVYKDVITEMGRVSEDYEKEKMSVPSVPFKMPIPPVTPTPIKKIEPEQKISKDEIKKEEFSEEKKEAIITSKPKSKKMIFVILGVVVIILALVGGFVFWWNYAREASLPVTHFECQEFQCISVDGEGVDECQVSADCVSVETQEPESLVVIENTETIEVSIGDEDNLSVFVTQDHLFSFELGLNKLVDKIKDSEKDNLTRILVKLSNNQSQYASLAEIMMLFNKGVTGFPVNLLNKSNDYTLLAYNPSDAEKDICEENNILDESCYGPRLVLVIKMSDTNLLKSSLLNWEETIVDDLENIILSPISKIEGIEFQDSSMSNYKGAELLRYINLPITTITVDYAIKDDLLIIGTSKNTTRRVLDALEE